MQRLWRRALRALQPQPLRPRVLRSPVSTAAGTAGAAGGAAGVATTRTAAPPAIATPRPAVPTAVPTAAAVPAACIAAIASLVAAAAASAAASALVVAGRRAVDIRVSMTPAITRRRPVARRRAAAPAPAPVALAPALAPVALAARALVARDVPLAALHMCVWYVCTMCVGILLAAAAATAQENTPPAGVHPPIGKVWWSRGRAITPIGKVWWSR